MSKDRLVHYIRAKLQEDNRPIFLSDIIEFAQAVHIELNKKQAYKFPTNEMHGHTQLSKKQRLYATSQVCALCKIAFTGITEATIDHIIPKSKGGGNELTNLQLAHFECNNRKADKIL